MLPRGPFDLAAQNQYFGEWESSPSPTQASTTLVFPVEGWTESAAVAVTQSADGEVHTAVHGARDERRAAAQALSVLSLDVDGGGYPDVGKRDPVIGSLLVQHHFLRPVLFHSPYEAACSFVIGHRMRIAQGRAIRRALAEQHGERIEVGERSVHAFPAPQRLVEVRSAPSLTPEKIERLHGVAQAAMDGWLNREQLRSLPLEEAMASVRRLRGVGDFFAAGIVLRGAGMVDAFPGDEITRAGIKRFYALQADDDESVTRIVDGWRPFRTWCSVLVHAAERRAR